MTLSSLSVYVHIPFCRKRCVYCDFNTYAEKENLVPEYVNAVLGEIEFYKNNLAGKFYLKTIYFGGGTPTLLSPGDFERIINTIVCYIDLDKEIEISTEANPTNLSGDYLLNLQKAGINRLSIGAQSAILQELQVLGRTHSAADIKQAVKNAGRAGFTNINVDLMYGIPRQTLKSFKQSLEFAASLKPQHLSIYGLGVEEGTPLSGMVKNGVYDLPDEEVSAAMYEYAMETLAEGGFNQYEISNWAKSDDRDFRSQHNLQYWRNKDYLGIGAGAHSHVENRRWYNSAEIENYISKSKKASSDVFPAVEAITNLTNIDHIKEAMMMGLRLTEEGVNISALSEKYEIKIEQYYKKEISRLVAIGLVKNQTTSKGEVLRLTRKGRLLGNQVFQEFV